MGITAYETFIERVHQHHVVGVNSSGTGNLAYAECIKRRKPIWAQLYACTNFSELRGLLQHLHTKTLTHQRQRRCNAATGHKYGVVGVVFLITLGKLRYL